MRLYLIRHGETDYNRQHIMQGHSEQPLNDLGIRQAAALARAMAALPLDHIYASDIRRAAMTAAIIAAATGAPITWEPLLRERNPGIFTHRPYAEAAGFFVDPDFAPEGGENVPVFESRVAEAVKAILEREGDAHPRRHIAAVTHGMFCAAFIRVLGLEPDGGPIRWPNASMTVADYTDGKWRIATLAETGHLEEEALGAVISLPAHEVAENGGATGG